MGELTDRLGVSEVTIRKDLTILEEMGYLVRTRGGARLAEDSRLLRNLDSRRLDHVAAKRDIAGKAREFIREGDTIFIDSGSTCLQLAGMIRGWNLRVLTNSLDVMVELSSAAGISLFSLGGSYRREAGSFLGPIALDTLKNFNVETCFLGATGFTDRGVFTAQNVIESQLKRRVLDVTGRRIILADSSKFGVTAFSVFANAEDVDVLITDDAFTEDQALKKHGIEVLGAQSI